MFLFNKDPEKANRKKELKEEKKQAMKDWLNIQQERKKVFLPDKVYTGLKIDNQNRICYVGGIMIGSYLSFDEILSAELYDDAGSIQKSNGVGRAVGGGLLFGPAGAIVGALTAKKKSFVTRLYVTVRTKIPQANKIDIDLIVTKTKTSGFAYKGMVKTADDIMAELNQIIAENQEPQVIHNYKSPVEQVKELKELLDMGVITQEEFDKKKNELLEL
ncbi:SHOCT domain-containing protein [Neobacillus sp. NPDC093127]|uniref:SHOCT domain-containing protein n=1 Tax=Neobacillus sp. NPDC093127 TaxID=3364296 RepID=UPI0037FB4B95